MNQTTIRVFNFSLIFTLALLTTYFTLENTASATINLIPGLSGSLPVAALVIISIGIGACGSWLFSSWSDKLRGDEIKELEDTKNRIKELESDLNRFKAKENNITSVTSLSNQEEAREEVA